MRSYTFRPNHVRIECDGNNYWMPQDRAERLREMSISSIHPKSTTNDPAYFIPAEHFDRISVFLELAGPITFKAESRKKLNKQFDTPNSP